MSVHNLTDTQSEERQLIEEGLVNAAVQASLADATMHDDDHDASKYATATEAELKTWSCGVCTLQNTDLALMCGACSIERPSDKGREGAALKSAEDVICID